MVSAISLLFGILMYLFHQLIPGIKGPLQWCYGSFSIVFGSLLFNMHPILPQFIVFVVSGTLSVLGISLYWAGIREYKNLHFNYLILIWIGLFQFVWGTIFYLADMPNVRMIGFSAISILILVLIIREFIQPVDDSYRLAFLLCSVVFSISALTSMYRIYAIVTLLPGEAHTATPAFILFYFMSNITQALLLGSFLLLISVKISERLKLKVEAQRKLFSVIAHDLSGPMGMMNTMLNTANHDEEFQGFHKEAFYKEVENLSSSTYHLLQNLLFWSRNELEDLKPHINPFDLNKIILDTIDFLKQIGLSKNITIDYKSSPELTCLGDERMIETVIRNLISNAIKFSFTGARILVSAENTGEYIVIKVSDQGIGISPEIQKSLFKYTENASKSGTKGERGTGLGLLLCKEFVEGNNGSIKINSTENVGTDVLVTLPAAKQLPS